MYDNQIASPAQREPEIHREQETLNERISTMDKACAELRCEIGQLEQGLKIALRPAQDNPKSTGEGAVTPEHPPCVTQLGDGMRHSADNVHNITRQVWRMIEDLRDIRGRCELPRSPEAAQAMPEIYPEIYPGTRDASAKY